MRRRQALIALGLSGLIIGGSWTIAKAADRPSAATEPSRPEPRPSSEKQAREKFAKLLLPDGSPKQATPKRRGVVVNAFGSTRVIIK